MKICRFHSVASIQVGYRVDTIFGQRIAFAQIVVGLQYEPHTFTLLLRIRSLVQINTLHGSFAESFLFVCQFHSLRWPHYKLGLYLCHGSYKKKTEKNPMGGNFVSYSFYLHR